MQGFYDLSGFAWEDTSYLADLKGISFQFTVLFGDGDMISILTTIDARAKPIVEIFSGKREGIPIDFTLKTEDFIKAHQLLPVQTASLIHWAGFNFENFKANRDVLAILTNLLVRSFQVKALSWKSLSQILFILLKTLPKRWIDLIIEEFHNGKKRQPRLAAKGNLLGSSISTVEDLVHSGKNVLYKLLLFPFSAILPVDWPHEDGA